MSAADEANVYGEGNTNQPDFNALLDSWESEIDEHTKAGEYGIAEGLRVASDELIALLRAAADPEQSNR